MKKLCEKIICAICQLIHFVWIAFANGAIYAFCFWVLYKYIIAPTEQPYIIFADFIEKKKVNNYTRYSIRYMSVGKKDLLAFRRIEKLYIKTHDKTKPRKRSVYLEIGDSDIVPIIHGSENFKKDAKHEYEAVSVDMHINNVTEFLNETLYSKATVKKAKKQNLTLDYVMQNYCQEIDDDYMRIEIYFLGNDDTGKMFTFSKTYKLSDIKSREFKDNQKGAKKISWLDKIIKSRREKAFAELEEILSRHK